MGWTTWGEVSRTLVTPLGGGGSEARVVTRPRYQLDFWPATAQSLRLISEIDRLLGAGAIALADGDHVRWAGANGLRREGLLAPGRPGQLLLVPLDSESERLPLSAVNELEIARQRIATAQQSRELAADLLQGEEKSFRLGRSSSLDVLDAQQALASAEREEARAKVAYATSLSLLFAVRGDFVAAKGLADEVPSQARE